MTMLPRLYWIADLDAAMTYGVDLLATADRYVAAGGRLLSLRIPPQKWRQWRSQGATLASICARSSATLLVHRHLELALEIGAHGLHLPSTSDPRAIADARQQLGDQALLFRSCHHGADLELAQSCGVDAVTLSPFFPSLSKPGHHPRFGAEQLQELCRRTSLPVYALGGITPENGAQALAMGAFGLSTIGAITGADDISSVTSQFRALL